MIQRFLKLESLAQKIRTKFHNKREQVIKEFDALPKKLRETEYSRYKEYADKISKRFNDRIKSVETLMQECANAIKIVPSDAVFSLYEIKSSYPYSTQTAPSFYAMNSARLLAETLNNEGFSTHITCVSSYEFGSGSFTSTGCDYAVWVNIDEVSVRILKIRGLTITQSVYMEFCNRTASNPRVL